jgi:ATP-dependent Lon protease
MEPGIRKLKEILFDIYGEINIELLKCKNYESMEYPIHITVELLEKKYLKKYIKIHEKLIYDHSIIGTINGLWANSLGKGGILPIESIFFPSSVFLELKLTGLQGDVMKESMNVAKSLAWTLTPDTRKSELLKYFDDTRCSGLHIHCPEGAVSKDGPSAGAAITTTIYSLFNNKKIKNTFAMTGEIDLRGNITAIGGLENKIIGGIRAGVKTFLFPKSNNTEFREFKTKYLINDKFKDITFIQVQTISDVFDVIFE